MKLLLLIIKVIIAYHILDFHSFIAVKFVFMARALDYYIIHDKQFRRVQ